MRKSNHDYFLMGVIAQLLVIAVVALSFALGCDVVISSLRNPPTLNIFEQLFTLLTKFFEEGSRALSLVGAVAFWLLIILILIAKKRKIQLLQSFRLSYFLRRSLKMDLTVVPKDNLNFFSQSLSTFEKKNKRVNRVLRRAKVILYKDKGIVIVPLPIEIESQKLLYENMDLAIKNVARIVDMKTTTRQFDMINVGSVAYYQLVK